MSSYWFLWSTVQSTLSGNQSQSSSIAHGLEFVPVKPNTVKSTLLNSGIECRNLRGRCASFPALLRESAGISPSSSPLCCFVVPYISFSNAEDMPHPPPALFWKGSSCVFLSWRFPWSVSLVSPA